MTPGRLTNRLRPSYRLLDAKLLARNHCQLFRQSLLHTYTIPYFLRAHPFRLLPQSHIRIPHNPAPMSMYSTTLERVLRLG